MTADRLKSLAHHCQQEQRRLEALTRSMAALNPKQLDHLQHLQANFNFRERVITTKISDGPFGEEVTIDDYHLLHPQPEDTQSVSMIDGDDQSYITHDPDDQSVQSQQSGQGKSLGIPATVQGSKVFDGSTINSLTGSVHSGDQRIYSKIHRPTLSKEDTMLLDRVKWMLSRVGDLTNDLTQRSNDNATYPHPSRPVASSSSVSSSSSSHFIPRNSSVVVQPSTMIPNVGSSGDIFFEHIPPIIQVKIGNTDQSHDEEQEEHDRELEGTFASAVTAATAAILGAIDRRIVSHRSLVASDYLGVGSQYMAAKMLLGMISFLQTGITIFESLSF